MSFTINLRWWKVYFFLMLMLTIVGFTVPFFIEKDKYLDWWEWLFYPLSVVQVIGLYGFVYRFRLGNPSVWQAVFLISLIYESWNLFQMFIDAELKKSDDAVFLLSMIGTSMILEVPMFIALFLYGYRFNKLWNETN